MTEQKQPPEVFYEKKCSYKFHKIHKKTPVPESFLIKLRATYFYRTPQVAASENIKFNR